MQRYFVEEKNWTESSFIITGDDVHHIDRVMRMDEGDQIICIHPELGAALCKIVEISNDQIGGEVMEWVKEDRESPVAVTIVQSLGKGDKLEQVVQKGTELGVYDFIPYQADRSVAKWDQKKATKKIQRLQKIAKEASEQSERTHIPVIHSLHSLKEIIDTSEGYDWCLFAHEDEARQANDYTLASTLQVVKKGERMLVVFGPEGGFSNDEVKELKKHDFITVRLGPRILRMETSPLYFLSSLSYQLEEMKVREE